MSIDHPTTHISNTQELEQHLAKHLSYREVIAISSVKEAYSLVFSTLKESSHVLCSPNAPIELFTALNQQKLQPAYCDLRLDGTMETRFFHKTMQPNTKALVLSHNHGILSDMGKAAKFSQEHDLLFIEDATQAFSNTTKSGAQLVIYSLDRLVPSSVATGAFIATDYVVLANTLRNKAKGGFEQQKLWNYDIINTDKHVVLSSLTAQFTLDALMSIELQDARIKEVQSIYFDKLSANRLIELPKASDLTPHPLFQVNLIPALFCPKEDIYEALIAAGVPVQVGNKPIYKTSAFKDVSLSLFGAEEVFKAQLLLPSHHLMKDEDVFSVIETLKQVLETYGYRGCSF